MRISINIKTIFTLIIPLLLIFFISCSNDIDYRKKLKIEDFIWEVNKKYLQELKDSIAKFDNNFTGKKIFLKIHNNPFDLNEKDTLVIWIEGKIIYKHSFMYRDSIIIPQDAINKYELIGMMVLHERKYYDLTYMYDAIEFSENMKNLSVVFCPTNQQPYNVLFFVDDWKR